jgi:SOS regulatory protein LexA
MNEIGSFLKSLRKEKGITFREAALRSGLSHSYIRYLEIGKRPGTDTPINPTPETLKRLSVAYNYPYDDLLIKAGYLDEGSSPETKEVISKGYSSLVETQMQLEMLLEKLEKNGVPPQIVSQTIYNTLNIKNQENYIFNRPYRFKQKIALELKLQDLNLLLGALGMLSVSNEIILDPNILRVPIMGTIPAGMPVIANEYIEDYTTIPNLWNLKEGEVFVLKVKGDSMIGSRIFDGDKVVVKVQPNVENGEIAVVNVNGEDATLKRVKKIDGQVILYPDNPKFEPIFLKNENARIIGKVIQVMFEPKRM